MNEFTYGNGYSDGQFDTLNRIIELLEDSDSACSGWAIALIKEGIK